MFEDETVVVETLAVRPPTTRRLRNCCAIPLPGVADVIHP
jgi:hypothetical protein